MTGCRLQNTLHSWTNFQPRCPLDLQIECGNSSRRSPFCPSFLVHNSIDLLPHPQVPAPRGFIWVGRWKADLAKTTLWMERDVASWSLLMTKHRWVSSPPCCTQILQGPGQPKMVPLHPSPHPIQWCSFVTLGYPDIELENISHPPCAPERDPWTSTLVEGAKFNCSLFIFLL